MAKAPILEHTNPYDHFRQYGFEPILSDVALETQTNQIVGLLRNSIPYLQEMKQINENSVLNEFFYALFFAYEESNMDGQLKFFFEHIKQKYASRLMKNNFLTEVFNILLGSKDIQCKQIFMLMMIGCEPNLQEHIRKIYKKNLEDNHVLNPHLIDVKRERLLKYISILVSNLTLIKEPIKIHNAPRILKDDFLKVCLNLYQHGSVPELILSGI